jgi:hypothetical protein
METDQDQHKIIFDATAKVLGHVYDNRLQFIPEAFLPSFEDAWSEVKKLISVGRLAVAERWEQHEPAIRAAFLAGKQLRLKFEIIGQAFAGWREKRFDRKLLKDLLRALRSFFDSLVSALPLAEGIKEFIDAILNIMEEEVA